MVSMKQIAEACGVSVATVSKALSNHSDIGVETKTRIRLAAKEMGYLPNSAAKALKTKRTDTIGVLYLDASNGGFTHDFFANVLNGFKKAIEEKGFDITFVNVSKDRPGSMSYLDHCRYRGFDGVLIACIDYDNPGVIELIESDIPLVMIDRRWHGRSSVLSNNIQGMRTLTEYIISQGHRRIAYVHGENGGLVTKERVESFLKVCSENGIEIPEEYLLEAKYRDTVSTKECTAKLLELDNPPSCILLPDDFAAFGGINAIREKNLSIPEDISVAGYDGILLARSYKPRLTTVAQNTAQIGRKAAEVLAQMIELGNEARPQETMIDAGLLKGESVAPYRDKSVE